MVRFTDEQLLDPNFPNPRLKNHKELRHAYYRKQVADEKRSKAIQLYSKGWIAILWELWTGLPLPVRCTVPAPQRGRQAQTGVRSTQTGGKLK